MGNNVSMSACHAAGAGLCFLNFEKSYVVKFEIGRRISSYFAMFELQMNVIVGSNYQLAVLELVRCRRSY